MKISDKDIQKIEAIESQYEVTFEVEREENGYKLTIDHSSLPIELTNAIDKEIISKFGSRLKFHNVTMSICTWHIQGEENEEYDCANIGKYFTEKYGNDLSSRIEKLKEETSELFEATSRPQEFWDTLHVLDELADVTAVTYHIAYICGMTLDELVKKAYGKVKRRETEPDCMRK